MKYPFRRAGRWPASMLALAVAVSACSDRAPLIAGADEAAVRAAAQDELLTLEPGAGLSGEQRERIARVRAQPTSADVQVARLAATPAALLQQGRALVLDVGIGKRFVALGERVVERTPASGAYLAWSGPLRNAEGWVDLVLTAKGVTGVVRAGGETYSVGPLGGGLHAVTRLDPRKVRADHAPDAFSAAEPPVGGPRASAQASGFVPAPSFGAPLATRTPATYAGPWIDVLVLYTPVAAAQSLDIAGSIALAVEQANVSYENSYVNLGMYLASAQQVTYDEGLASHRTHIDRMKNTGDSQLETVPTLRNSNLADAVVLVVDDDEGGQYCGLADVIGATAATAFAVVHWDCLGSGYWTLAHEVGHLQGARHERTADAGTTPYAYGHGFPAPNKAWRTIMATPNACVTQSCPRINYWSTPFVTYSDGQAMGTSNHEYDALVLNNTAKTLRDFRTLPVPNNVVHSNPGIAYAKPALSWTAVPGATLYAVERCIYNYGGSYTSMCWARPDGPNVTTNSFQELYIQQTNGSTCPRIARYRVRTDSREGLSAYNTEIALCIY